MPYYASDLKWLVVLHGEEIRGQSFNAGPLVKYMLALPRDIDADPRWQEGYQYYRRRPESPVVHWCPMMMS